MIFSKSICLGVQWECFTLHMRGFRGGLGVWMLPDKSQSYRFSVEILVRTQWTKHKASQATFNVGPSKRHLNGVSLAGR